jgi:glycosyltransferase involved in cell wall biosynthesis
MDGSVWVILPTYDEAENLEAVVGGIRAAVPEAHILVVDDNSRDGTGELADRLAAEDPALEVLHRPGKAGLGRAYTAGFARALAAGADYLVEMDADLSHDPADLPRLIAPAADGADLVLGSRYVHGGGIENWGLQRRLISLAGCEYARRVLGGGHAARDRRRQRRRAGLRLPGRADVARAVARAARGRGADPLPRAPARPLQDVRPDRARGGLARPGPASRARALGAADGRRPSRRSAGA